MLHKLELNTPEVATLYYAFIELRSNLGLPRNTKESELKQFHDELEAKLVKILDDVKSSGEGSPMNKPGRLGQE